MIFSFWFIGILLFNSARLMTSRQVRNGLSWLSHAPRSCVTSTAGSARPAQLQPFAREEPRHRRILVVDVHKSICRFRRRGWGRARDRGSQSGHAPIFVAAGVHSIWHCSNTQCCTSSRTCAGAVAGAASSLPSRVRAGRGRGTIKYGAGIAASCGPRRCGPGSHCVRSRTLLQVASHPVAATRGATVSFH